MSRSSIIVAIVLVLAVGGWLASGLLVPADKSLPAAKSAEPQPPLVEVVASHAEPVTRHIISQGDVRAFRTAPARAETAGQIDEILVDVGERVETGQPLARLTSEGRASRLREAEALFDQRKADYDAAASLLARGFTTEARVRELNTLLQSARENVRQLEEEVDNTTIASPFAGVVNALEIEEGEFVQVNAEIATLVDNSPLRVDVRVNQQDVARIPKSGVARVSFATGASENGRVCFVSAAADPQTRTFRVEVRTANADNAISSGISAEVSIPTGDAMAHFVSPAILSLGTDGALGIKSVSDDRIVEFHEVEVVRAETDGVWVSGMPQDVNIITIGQGSVQQGETVRLSQAEQTGRMSVADEQPRQPRTGAQDDFPSTAICGRNPVIDGDAKAQTAAVSDSGEPETPNAVGGPELRIARAEAPETASGTPDFDNGKADPETIARVQRSLNRLGFDAGTADGTLGQRTRDAVKAYRQENGLDGDGGLDAATARLIIEQASADPASGAGQ